MKNTRKIVTHSGDVSAKNKQSAKYNAKPKTMISTHLSFVHRHSFKIHLLMISIEQPISCSHVKRK